MDILALDVYTLRYDCFSRRKFIARFLLRSISYLTKTNKFLSLAPFSRTIFNSS